jgi:predicted transglutaminase-like cysteine proteinase
MKLRRIALASAVLALAPVVMAAPAQAADSFGMTSALAASAATSGGQGCTSPVQPRLGETKGELATSASKVSALLGGRPSQLELIARQQAAPSPTRLAADQALDMPGKGITPGAGGAACMNFARPALFTMQPAFRRGPLASGDFLASKRLKVRRTSFDSSWNRIRKEALPRSMSASFRQTASGKVTWSTIAAVNAWTNARVRYVEDRVQYGQADYWAKASYTLERREGDCEDIAIAKLQLLAAMGIPRSDLYLTIARDLARNADHALLVVRFEGRFWLLDNATDQLLDASESYDYRPVMSFNGKGKWVHGY